MKVEMGESLMYSWLCHIKGCQIVQTNWKASPAFAKHNGEAVAGLYQAVRERFALRLAGGPFKSSLDQFIKQAEVDVLGTAFSEGGQRLYAVDIAFHEGGLSYGSKEATAAKITMKYLRTALCLRLYFGSVPGEIAFASPKINPADMLLLTPLLSEVQAFFADTGLPYTAALYANGDFASAVLDPVLEASRQVADTSELFMRSYQLCRMFRRT